jgi:DNA ligase-1
VLPSPLAAMTTIDLADGSTAYIQGSAAKPYELKNTGGVYSCSCPAWRNQSLGIEKRTCKHLKALRGDAAEAERTGNAVPPPRSSALSSSSSSSSSEADKPPVLLAHKWEPHVDVTGWWLSEKLDGVRAYWTGERFLSRLGNEFFAPEWFVKTLPETPLDGELWVGRGEFQRTVSIVRRQDRSDLWREVSFLVFDAPDHGGVFEERITWVRETLRDGHEHAGSVDHYACEGLDHLRAELARIEGLGGEGLMARKPKSKYVAGRSHTLLKVKSFSDTEARVVGHVAGRGRHKGRLGAVEAVLADGTRFSVGTGFSDAERESPPPIGSVITVRYQELSKDGVPRFPAYAGVRADVELPEINTSTKTSTSKIQQSAGKAKTGENNMAARYFEYSDGKSHKFWEISVEGASHTVRYGRIGASGTVKTKEFGDEDAASADAAKLVAQKVKKGYEETAAGETESKPVERAKPKKTDEATKAKADAAAAEGVEGLRYFELSDGKSHKFWEISVDGASHTVRYGKIGTNGTAKTKDFDDEDAAMKDATKLVAQKVKKGYEETEPSE